MKVVIVYCAPSKWYFAIFSCYAAGYQLCLPGAVLSVYSFFPRGFVLHASAAEVCQGYQNIDLTASLDQMPSRHSGLKVCITHEWFDLQQILYQDFIWLSLRWFNGVVTQLYFATTEFVLAPALCSRGSLSSYFTLIALIDPNWKGATVQLVSASLFLFYFYFLVNLCCNLDILYISFDGWLRLSRSRCLMWDWGKSHVKFTM